NFVPFLKKTDSLVAGIIGTAGCVGLWGYLLYQGVVDPLGGVKPSEEELHQAMLNGIRDKGLSVLNWTPEAEQFRLRLHCAAKW
ncbi:hypothetical protein MJN85_32535, partial [Salmonella enterica subsp. enterica serovar Anatum]|nr:hypothetical protein [Salmonella enterica subsp. enterica serovar Anatum]